MLSKQIFLALEKEAKEKGTFFKEKFRKL